MQLMRKTDANLIGWPALAAAGLLVAAAPAAAQSSAPLPLWELGTLGLGVSQQAYPGSNEQVNRGLVLPSFVYRGKFLRADRETAGLRALKTSNFELDIGVAGSFGARSGEIDARQGMPNLGTLVEFGPRIKWKLGEGWGGGRWQMELPLRGVFDLSDGAAHRGMALEPEISFQRRANGGWVYTTSVSAIMADRRLAKTFYAVDSAYALADRPAFEAQSGLVAWRLSTSFSRSLSRDWRLFGFGRIDSVSGAANQSSPLVKQTHGASVGFGLNYTWLRSQSGAND